ncbi:MAG: hypothetical protein GXO39_01640 [Thermotogae bacterium]|nr:hypothetical protein [Thermotogota bacterium]
MEPTAYLRKLVKIKPSRAKHPVYYISIPSKYRGAYENERVAALLPVDEDRGIFLLVPHRYLSHARRLLTSL